MKGTAMTGPSTRRRAGGDPVGSPRGDRWLATTREKVRLPTTHRSIRRPRHGACWPTPAAPWPETAGPPAGSTSPRSLPGVVVPPSPGGVSAVSGGLRQQSAHFRTLGGVRVAGTWDLASPEAPAASGTDDSLCPRGREGTCGRATAAELAGPGRGALPGGSGGRLCLTSTGEGQGSCLVWGGSCGQAGLITLLYSPASSEPTVRPQRA